MTMMQRVPTDMLEALDPAGVLQFPPIDASGDVTSSTILRGSLVEQAQIATPTTLPPAGSMFLYPKADNSYYSLDSAGVERPLGGGGGGEITLPLDVPSYIRTQGGYGVPATGRGLELTWTALGGVITSIDRSAGALYNLTLRAGYQVVLDTNQASYAFTSGGDAHGINAIWPATDALQVWAPLQQEQMSTPLKPSTNRWRLYPKTDGYYQLDSFGVETKLGGGGGGTTDPLDPWQIDEFGNLVPKVTGGVDLGSQPLRPANLWTRNKLVIGGLTYWDGVSLNDIGELTVPDSFALKVGNTSPLYVTVDHFEFWKPLHFRDDNTHDIGSSPTWGRPRDLFLGRDLNVAKRGDLGTLRVTDNIDPPVGTTGAGVEVVYSRGSGVGTGTGYIQSWDRDISAARPLNLTASQVNINAPVHIYQGAAYLDLGTGAFESGTIKTPVELDIYVGPATGSGDIAVAIYDDVSNDRVDISLGRSNNSEVRVNGYLDLVPTATPAAPYNTQNNARLFVKPGDPAHVFNLDSAGVEHQFAYLSDVGTGGGGGLTLPLTQPLTFSPDNTHDIGANTASRPRDAYVGGKVYLGDSNTAWIGRGDSANSVQFAAGIQPLNANSGNLGEAHRKFNALFLSGGMVSNSWEMIGSNSRITGPMGWTDPAGRFYLQASGVADPTWVNARPNNAGTGGTAAGWRAFQLGDQNNSPYAAFGIDATGALIDVGKFGTATTLPLVVKFDGVEKLRLALNGDLTVVGNVSTPRVGAPGTATDLILATGGVDRWHIDDTTGVLRPATPGTLDLGRSGSEIRDLHMKRAIGVGVSPTSYTGISFKGTLTGGTGPQVGIMSNPSFDSTISTYGACFYSQPKTVTGTGNVAAVYGLICFGPMLGSSSEIFNATGIYVASQELVGTKAIGIQIADQGSANVGLLNNGRTELNAPVDMELLTASQQVAPASGKIRLYANATTGHLHQKSSSGADIDLAAGGGSGGVTFPLLAPDGTASAPSYAFSADSRLGMMKSPAGGVAITAGGWERLRVHGSGATVTGTLDFSGYMEMTKQVAPVVPAANELRLYASSVTGHLHQIDSAGVDTDLAAGGGGGGLTLPLAQALTFSPDATHDIGPVGQRPRAIHAGGTIRSTGQTVPTEGVGLEMQYQGSNGIAYLSAYNRGGNAAIPLTIQGSRVTIEAPLYGGDFSFTSGSIYGNGTGMWVNSMLTAMQASIGLLTLQPLAMGGISVAGGYEFSPHADTGALIGVWANYLRINTGIIKNGGDNVGVSDLGLYSVQPAQWVRIVACTNELNLFADGSAGNNFGGTTPSLSLKTSGDVTNHRAAMNATAFNVTSSARFKANLLPFPDAEALARVTSPLAGLVTWDSYYKAPPPKAKGSAPSAGPEYIPNARQIGFTAEDMEAIVPEVVAHDELDLPATVAYDNLVAVLWGALREYVARTDARIAALEAQR